MENIKFRELHITECIRINEMNPYQFIGKAWREVDGKRQLVEINYEDTNWPNGYDEHYNALRHTISSNGIAIGAIDGNKLIGFITINKEPFGEKYRYVLLDQLFISLEYRNKGIGRTLFNLGVERARKWDVDKLYICAGSAEETIAFYFKIGCIEAIEINKAFYEDDPRDYQLEYSL